MRKTNSEALKRRWSTAEFRKKMQPILEMLKNSRRGKQHTKRTIRKMRRSAKLREEKNWLKKPRYRSCPNYGCRLEYSRQDMLMRAIKNNSLCKSCAKIKDNPMHVAEHREKLKGRQHTAVTKRKMRVIRLREIKAKHGVVSPNYNPKACRLIEEYGKAHGYNFQHAENGGEFHIKELGYFVDGYDAEKNAVIEVYEPHHRKL